MPEASTIRSAARVFDTSASIAFHTIPEATLSDQKARRSSPRRTVSPWALAMTARMTPPHILSPCVSALTNSSTARRQSLAGSGATIIQDP